LLERLWSNRTIGFWLALALPAAAILLSLIADRRFSPAFPPPVAIGATILIALFGLASIGRRPVFAICLAALMMSYGGWTTLRYSFLDIRTRSYFGIYTVAGIKNGTGRALTHGTTVHGVQNTLPGMEEEPTSYYTRGSGVGRVMATADVLFGPAARIGVVGLGTGTLACYAKPGQSWTFFEIDPAMVRIATDREKFTFISRCTPEARILLGDARLKLSQVPAHSLDILAVDAFSSDAVPMHLLTQEALRVYGRALQPKGVLMMHISNRYLDLEPVLAVGAKKGGWHTAVYSHGSDDRFLNDHPSIWVAMTRDPQRLEELKHASRAPQRWRQLQARPGFAGWTDDYASILPLLEGLTR
jgi:SAM-dependent methyltransferase